MCGICGSVGVERSEEADGMVRRMRAALRHRGQDDETMLAAPHAELAIGLPKQH